MYYRLRRSPSTFLSITAKVGVIVEIEECELLKVNIVVNKLETS